MTENKANEKCPECGTRGYLILPGFNNCQTCLKLRLEVLDKKIEKRDDEVLVY